MVDVCRLGVKSAGLHEVYSAAITQALKSALQQFEQKIPGFVSDAGLLHGVETRTSSPVCCAALCCAALRCAVLCCAVLCCAVLCCAVLRCAVLCFSAVRLSSDQTNKLFTIRTGRPDTVAVHLLLF